MHDRRNAFEQFAGDTKTDKKLTTLHAVEVHPQRTIVLATTEATVAAGFESHMTYVVRLMQDKRVLAKAEITLKD